VRDDPRRELVAEAEALDAHGRVGEIPQPGLVAGDRAAERLGEAGAVAQVMAVGEDDPLGRLAAGVAEPADPLVGDHRVDQRARGGEVCRMDRLADRLPPRGPLIQAGNRLVHGRGSPRGSGCRIARAIVTDRSRSRTCGA
jgi:hypothetical protein